MSFSPSFASPRKKPQRGALSPFLLIPCFNSIYFFSELRIAATPPDEGMAAASMVDRDSVDDLQYPPTPSEQVCSKAIKKKKATDLVVCLVP